jgi:hypothetical protein
MGYVGLTMPVMLARWSFTVYGVNASSAVLARPGHDSARLGELRPRIPGTGANGRYRWPVVPGPPGNTR